MNEPDNSAPVYTNPVYNRSCPDPYVFKHCGEYWCYSTGFWLDGRCFGVLHSTDLVRWRELSGAMEPLPGGATCYWAPEVIYDNGLFYMYYSVGNEVFMEIRVAVAQKPEGPFIDSGKRLTSEQFAIDPHVFQDDDGARYMFYATDFLEHEYIGTGTVLDRMLDLFTLAGRPRPVTRARFDWQVYDPNRAEKGGVRWHTVEGPFVLKRKGLYHQMFSGGNWKNMTYGVSYAVTDNIETESEWSQVCDGERVLPILRTIPGKVLGPGHNSVVRGPDNRQLYCVYHRWDEQSNARVLCIDRQDWAGDRIIVLGPTTTPDRSPLRPAFSGFKGDVWEFAGGRWSADQYVAAQESAEPMAEARCRISSPCFVAEVSLRALSASSEKGHIGVSISGEGEDALRFALSLGERKARISWQTEDEWAERIFDLPQGFLMDTFHLIRIEADDRFAIVTLDGATVRWAGRILLHPKRLALVTVDAPAEFAGFALTVGWQDEFVMEYADPAQAGWEMLAGKGRWHIAEGRLSYSVEEDGSRDERRGGMIAKGPALDSYELVVGVRLDDSDEGGCYGFYPALGAREPGPLFTIERAAEGWEMVCYEPPMRRAMPMPRDFDPFTYQGFRFSKQGGELSVQWNMSPLHIIRTTPEATRPGFFARAAKISLDLVRVTVITDNLQT